MVARLGMGAGGKLTLTPDSIRIEITIPDGNVAHEINEFYLSQHVT
jgi:hypothetical protein